METEETSMIYQDHTVFILHVMAPHNQAFVGSKLLPLFLALGLKHGAHDIFHRYKDNFGKQETLFSLASAMKPGTFILSQMNDFQTKGLSLFLAVPGPRDPMPAFDLMVQVARQLAAHLHGRLEDAHHHTLTAETLAQERARIAAFVNASPHMELT